VEQTVCLAVCYGAATPNPGLSGTGEPCCWGELPLEGSAQALSARARQL